MVSKIVNMCKNRGCMNDTVAGYAMRSCSLNSCGDASVSAETVNALLKYQLVHFNALALKGDGRLNSHWSIGS